MKLHDLQPAPGAHTARTRVGRGIAAGKGKTAGRGTKGQKARTGGRIPAWFEGGQTPIHIRIPKLRGFRNRGRIDYEVVNLGRISHLVELGELELADQAGGTGRTPARTAPITINQDILRAVGLVRTLNKPLKVLGNGDVSVPLFVVADAFSKSAIQKIQDAGGSVQVLEIPSSAMVALTGEQQTSVGQAAAPEKSAGKRSARPEAASTAKPRTAPKEKAEAAAKPKSASTARPKATARPESSGRPASTAGSEGRTRVTAGAHHAAQPGPSAGADAPASPAPRTRPAADESTSGPASGASAEGHPRVRARKGAIGSHSDGATGTVEAAADTVTGSTSGEVG